MTKTSPEMRASQLGDRRRHATLIAEYEAIIRGALRNDADFDAESPDVVRVVQLKANGGVLLMPSDVVPIGRAIARLEGAWTPDRRVLAELLSRTLENRSRRWLFDEDRYIAMPEEWPTVLRRQWPRQFDCELSIGPGWVDLLIATHTWLMELGADFRWSQIKEKFAGARFYFDGDVGEQGREIINVAESVLSPCICDECGAAGRKRRIGGWYVARCDEHVPEGE